MTQTSSSDEDETRQFKNQQRITYKTFCMRLSSLSVKIAMEKCETMPKRDDEALSVWVYNLKLVEFDWNFFYGLIDIAKANPLFKRLLFQFFVMFLLKTRRLELPAQKSSKINFKELTQFLRNSKYSHMKTASFFGEKTKYLLIKLKAINLVEKSHIIRAW
jgi:hypothetical protein